MPTSSFHGPRCSLFPEHNLLIFNDIPFNAPLRGFSNEFTDQDMQCIADNARMYATDNMVCSSWDTGTQRQGVGIPVSRRSGVVGLARL